MDHEIRAVGLVEVLGLPPAVVVADAMVKAAPIRLIDVEVNTLGAMIVKVAGETGAVTASFDVGRQLAVDLDALVGASIIPRYAPQGVVPWIDAPQKVTNLLKSRSSLIPSDEESPPFALGFIETQGYVGTVAAADAMVKTAAVQVVALEKIGAIRACVLVRGEVAAVEAAVEAGRVQAARVGHLAASATIPQPDLVIRSLFPGPVRAA